MHARRFLSVSFLCVLSACGGGGGDSPSGPNTTPVSVSTVTTSIDAGMTISPASISVEQGKQAIFTVAFKPGFGVKDISGCGGSLSGSTFTTAPVFANCTVTGSSKSTYTLNTLGLKPNALFSDEFANTPVLVEASTTNAAGLRLYAEYFANWFDRNAPPGMVAVPLFDDGTHGDRIAGDGIYSATLVTGLVPALRYHDRTVDRLTVSINAYDAAGNPFFPSNSIVSNLQLGVIARSEAVAPVKLGEGIFAAPNVVNIVMPDPASKYTDAMQRVYQYFPDVFDGFAIHLLGTGTGLNVPSGGPIKNIVQGINLLPTDISFVYGSKSVLSSSVFMASDIVGEVFLHEFGHTSAFYLNKPALDLTDGFSVHTGNSTVLGQMANNSFLKEQPTGDFLVTTPSDAGRYPSRFYANLELYLMGLLPPESVAPEYFVLDRAVNLSPGELIPRAKVSRVTIDDVVRVYGPRTPSVATSQKTFRFVFIALSETPATAAEIAIVNRVATFYAGDTPGSLTEDGGLFPIATPRAFKSATRGLAALVTRLPSTKYCVGEKVGSSGST